MPPDTTRPKLAAVGNYDLLEKIADGGMGTVYRGRQRDSGRIVAVKVMPAQTASKAVLYKRFVQEFQVARKLDHPNIVRALDFGQEGDTPFLVMEFVAGETLGQKIYREGRLGEHESLRIIAQVAQGLHRAHKLGLVHRDVKPDNILVMPDGTTKLADLGLVKESETNLNLTRTGRGLGTPHFMAPEQFRDAKNVDPRCDIYALGATLYMMVTGELPFRSSGPLDVWMKKMHNEIAPPRKRAPGLSERADWAIRRAMSADPEQRPATCREFIEDLTGRSTRKPAAAAAAAEGPGPAANLWYIVYLDEEGTTHTVKGSVNAIRRCLRDGLLGDALHVRVSRSKTGPFEPLRSHPEFRDLVVAPAALSLPPMPASDPETRAVNVPTSPVIIGGRVPTPVQPRSEPDEDEDLLSSLDLPPLQSRPVVEPGWWIKWLVLVLIAVVTGVVTYFLDPF